MLEYTQTQISKNIDTITRLTFANRLLNYKELILWVRVIL